MTDRPRKKIRFGQLRKVLLDLGYQIRTVDDHYIAFVHPRRALFVVLPAMAPETEVRPIDLLSVQKTLVNDGLVENEQQFTSLFLIKKGDRLIWNNPQSGRQTEVVAASGETTDGMVIIKLSGSAFSPCPVDQLAPAGNASVHS